MSSMPSTAPPSTGEWLDHLRRETGRFAEVAARSPLAAHVPAYPAFTVATLSAHIGRALRTFHVLVSAGAYPDDQVITAPTGPAVTGWITEGLEPLLAALAEVPPDRPVTFPHRAGQRPASLIAARAAA